MKIFIKLILSIPIILLLVILIGLNSKLYYKPKRDDGYNKDVYNQLKYLQLKNDAGAAYKMQELFPEGLMFFECLYGLAWADFISNFKTNSEIYNEGILEIDKCIKEVNSDFSKSIFYGETKLKNGAFFNGWSNYLLGKKLEIIPINNRSDNEIDLFKDNCNRISIALNESKTPYLETYPDECWPADVTLCLASLAVHDRIFDKKYDAIKTEWVEKVKLKLDKNGLIPHAVDAVDGKVLIEARGSSQSLILSFLPEIDSVFSNQQFSVFKKLFVESRLGLNAIREYPKGTNDYGDIDSGPVIWGIGTASTIVAQKASIKNNDFELALEIQNGIEAIGFPVNKDGKKYYLNGYLDIVDAFIVWSRSDDNITSKKNIFWWQLGFHLRSTLILFLFLYLLFLIWRQPRNAKFSINKPQNKFYFKKSLE